MTCIPRQPCYTRRKNLDRTAPKNRNRPLEPRPIRRGFVVQGGTMPATAQRKPAYVAASVQDLLGLWHGDDDVCGYWHPGIVTAVCELTAPETVSVVRSRFYPGRSAKETPVEAVRMILSGYQDWKARA